MPGLGKLDPGFWFERRSRSDCVHEQVAKRIANVRFTQQLCIHAAA